MYSLPKRPEQHIIDEQGIVLLQTIFEPRNYIFRNLGGRDYGIDGLLEVVENGNATGRMLSIQLKSSTQFPFFTDVMRVNNSIDEIIGSIPISIKQSTCTYWLQNQLPVILVLADTTNDCLYYIDAKMQLRQSFRNFRENESFTFHVPANTRLYRAKFENIKSKEDVYNIYHHMMFEKCKILAFEYPEFFNSIQDFVLNRQAYYEHIEHQSADPFLTQPVEFYNRTVHIQHLLEIISHQVGFQLDQINFREVREKYSQTFSEYQEYEKVVEIEITELHSRIMSNILNAIDPIKNFLINIEGDYWKIQYPQVHKEATEMSIDEFKNLCFWARINATKKSEE